MKSFIDLMTTEQEKDGCMGPTFKATVFNGKIKGGFGLYIRLFKSRFFCKGCEKCDWNVTEHMTELDTNTINVMGIEKVQEGGFYYIDCINIQKDWETGIVDDFDLILKKVSE